MAGSISAASPMRSLALTTYNSGRYLLEQLDSIRNQTLPFDEVIIVDDASSDGTPQMIQDYIAQHELKDWHLTIHTRNEGFVRSFRDALSRTSGRLVFLCDHDDIWHPDKAEAMSAQFEAHPELLALASSFELVDANGNHMDQKTSSRRANHNLIRRSLPAGEFSWLSFEDVMGYNVSPGCTLALTSVLRRQYLETPADMNLPHDWAICAIAAIENGLGYLDQELMGYRQHEDNTLGLARRSAYLERRDAAWQDYVQKEALCALARQFHAQPVQQEKMEEISRFFSQRAQALKDRSLFQLSQLLMSSAGAGFRLTIGMDIRTILSGSAKEDEESEENEQDQSHSGSGSIDPNSAKTDEKDDSNLSNLSSTDENARLEESNDENGNMPAGNEMESAL